MKHDLTQKELKEVLKYSEMAALKASRKLLLFQKKIKKLKISHKDAQGVASEADLVSEYILTQEMKKRFPKASVLAEEEAFLKFGNHKKEAFQKFERDDYCFVIDPLDGTHNYLAGMDYYGICISLVYKGSPITAMVFRPATGDCYFACLAGGAYKKNLYHSSRSKKLFQSKASNKLENSMLVTGFATEKGVVFDQEFAIFKKAMEMSRGVRRLGSAALDLCLVAEGVFDGFWERGLAPWDIAASGLVCQEAGVKVSDYSGGVFSPFGETILAARGPLHKNLLKLVNMD